MDAPEISIIPKPLRIERGGGEFQFSSDTPVALRDGSPELGPEGYRLTVDDSGVTFEADSPAAVFYAEQTLRQLLPPVALRESGATGPFPLPHVQITDAPRFRWRGVLLDVARHFLPKREVLRFLDLMALHKLNVLHWHLTEDQGWRVEIKRYPKLTEVGSWRRETVGDGTPHGGFYTQDDIREIVAYAAARHITIVPEIDIPGHSTAAIAAYPELGNQDVPAADAPREVWTEFGIATTVLNVEDATVEFYKNVMDEVCDLFPGDYVCLGGDECPKDEWKASARAQQRKAELGLTTEEDLQAWFLHQVSAHVAAKGRKLLGWDEILEGELFPGTIVSSWRGTDGAVEAARRGHDTLTSPYNRVYFDYRQSDDEGEPGAPWAAPTSLEHAYGFEPVPADMPKEHAAHVIGSEATLWSEYMPSPRIVDYQAFPRLAAFCETVWSAPERDFAEFRGRLVRHLERLDALGVEYRPLDGPHPWQKQPAPRWRPAPDDE
ncbi:MAG: family 20 glycosylhydrolase [Catenulispora sp.]|nr:family 20 glycosylhydrolase [Catenulispora sp.]